MTTAEVLNRLEDFKYPSRPKTGLWFNDKQYRLQAEYHSTEPICWITVEALVHYGKLSEEDLKRLIVGSVEPMRTVLADFFFSGWEINYYLKVGCRPRRSY